MIVFLVHGFNLVSILMCFAFSIFLVISVIDWRTFEIPFSLNVAIGVLGVIRIILDHKNLLDYLIGFCVISGFMLVCLFIGRAIKGIDAFGGGDIKLMAFARIILRMEVHNPGISDWLHLRCSHSFHPYEGYGCRACACIWTIFVCGAYDSHAFWYEYN